VNIPFPPELPCKEDPPPVLAGEGAEMNFGVEVTTYRCPNGYMWETGDFPYFEVECLNKKWSRKDLPACKSGLPCCNICNAPGSQRGRVG
jgi:hypothetical protein